MSGFLRDEGYEVKMFNLLDMANSDAWNCLSEIEHDKDLVQSIAEVIIKNTSNANERQDFWEKAELNLLMALMHYVASQTVPGTKDLLPIQQRSLGAIYRMLSNESFADLERRFEALPKGHPALPPYGIFKLANRQIWGNIAIGLGNRLSVIYNSLVDKDMSYKKVYSSWGGLSNLISVSGESIYICSHLRWASIKILIAFSVSCAIVKYIFL